MVSSSALALSVAVVVGAATAASACNLDHSAFERRAVNAARPRTRRAVDRSTWQAEAKVKDATQECTYYDFPPANTLLPTYPEIWKTADLSSAGISQNDKDLFASIAPGIPNIKPRGDRAGDFTGVVYDGNADPDCWWSYNKCTTPKLKGLPKDVTRCNEPLSWGYTLDDGPNCSHNAFFDYLQSIEQKATLFYIGSNVLDWPLEAQRGLADGHEICSHTWSHPYMTSMTNEQAFAELYFSKKAIKDILGITVRCWRPPYGDVDDRIRYIAQQLDMTTVIWTDDTLDWEWSTTGTAAVQKNYDDIFARQKGGKYNAHGTIVLSHEIDGTTMNISQENLPQIRKQFTGGVMPVAVCMNNTEPYLEQGSYVYPNYAQWMAGTRSVSLAAPSAVSTTGQEISFATAGLSKVSGPSATGTSSVGTAALATTSAAATTSGGSGASSSAEATAAQQSQGSQKSTTSGAASAQVVAPLVALLGAVVGVAAVL
ncbi:hypothetical protein JCM6882_000664 [Rhodosporidiobolus microsporus]